MLEQSQSSGTKIDTNFYLFIYLFIFLFIYKEYLYWQVQFR